MSSAQAVLVTDSEIALHPRDVRDAAEMFALVDRHRASLRDWLTWIDSTRSLAETRRYAQFAQIQAESRLGFDYAIRSRGTLVGSIGLHTIDYANRSTAIGYWLIPPARGQGIVTRAAATIVRHAFTNLGLHRLEIRCVVENAPSRSVAERLGFIFEGTLVEAYLLHGRFAISRCMRRSRRVGALRLRCEVDYWRACGRTTSLSV